MVYAKTDEEYGYAKGAMLEKLGGNDSHPLYKTFMDNWDNSQDEWVSFKRGNVPHLTNNTNNRIESKWGKNKDVIQDTFSIDELLSTLITLQEYAEGQYIAEYHRVGGRSSGLCEDEELSSLALQISKFSFNLVSEQYALTTGASADYEVELGSPGKASIKSPRTGNTYEVNTMRSKCDCIFMNTCLLPCRHDMFVRDHYNYETIIPPMRSFSTRWIVHSPVNNIAERDVHRGGLMQITCPALSLQSPMFTTDMHIETKALAEEIIDRMALQSTSTYRVALQWLQDFYGALNSGDVVEFSHREATFPGLSQVSSMGATRLSQMLFADDGSPRCGETIDAALSDVGGAISARNEPEGKAGNESNHENGDPQDAESNSVGPVNESTRIEPRPNDTKSVPNLTKVGDDEEKPAVVTWKPSGQRHDEITTKERERRNSERRAARALAARYLAWSNLMMLRHCWMVDTARFTRKQCWMLS